MIIPTPFHRIGRRQDLPNDTPDQTETQITPSTTTVDPTGTGLLSSAASGTNLAWWQLLCIALGGAIALCISIWIYWRHRRRRKASRKRKKEAEKEQDAKVKEELERQQKEEEDAKKGKTKKGKGRGSGSESWSSSEESYDSVSDGGTIRPRRRRKMGRGRGRRRGRPSRGRRKWSESESETESDSYDSDYSYVPRNRRRRGRRRGRYSEGDSDDEINDIYDRRGGGRKRGGRRYEPETPTPPVPPLPAKARNKRETFRDSVFFSYSSMKKAAVRLKYVEQKVKLKKQLEAEEEVEHSRRNKVVQANKEIKRQKEEEERAKMIEEIRAEKKMRRVEKEMEEANREVEEANRRLERSRRPMSTAKSSGDSGQPLIPPARSYTLSSSGGSSASLSQFRSPPARRRPIGQSTYDRQPQIPPPAKLSQPKKADTLFDAGALDTVAPVRKSAMRPPARKQSTFAPTAVLPYATPHPPAPTRKGSGFGTEINHLLGTRDPGRGQSKAFGAPVPKQSLDQMRQGFTHPPLPPEPPPPQNAFQASWLSRPDPSLSVPQTARTDSVYVPVTRPKDRPIIPPGGLAPAPPGKKKASSPPAGIRGQSVAVPSAGGGNKWADRMRARR